MKRRLWMSGVQASGGPAGAVATATIEVGAVNDAPRITSDGGGPEAQRSGAETWLAGTAALEKVARVLSGAEIGPPVPPERIFAKTVSGLASAKRGVAATWAKPAT